jgi:LmbE family N-acetylglucosaminyl deacetylase
MTTTPLTLMAVHAHPDDEATSTGGILARYSAEGVRTVLVTCTNGELGDGPDGLKPAGGAYTPEQEAVVVALRRRELEESRRVLGVQHLELLGYHDSGMEGWASNHAPGVFAQVPVEQAAVPLVALIRRYQPQVVVTYDDYGFYGHPDHIQAHRITVAALDAAGSDARLYFPSIRRSRLPLFRQSMVDLGMEPPDIDEDKFGVPDEMIAASVDIREYARAKRSALAAHASQEDNLFFLRFPEESFAAIFGVEEFVQARPAERPAAVADDLFAGLREAVRGPGSR